MPYYDYQASISALIKRLQTMRETKWSPTPQRNELLALAKKLEETADLMAQPEYMDVEEAVDTDPLPETGLDGFPVTVYDKESRLGLFTATTWRLREIAQITRKEAESLPAPQARREVPFAASVVLHIWYQCEKDRPSFYDDGEAVTELSNILEAAGIHLSRSRVRTALADAWKTFDPLDDPNESDAFLVMAE